MNLDRRDLLLSGPAALFGLQFIQEMHAQGRAGAPVDSNVVDFWNRGMGVPAHDLVGGARTRGRQPSGPAVSDYSREPLFLHHDPDEHVLLTPDQIPEKKLAASGNTEITFHFVRMRLNPEDNTRFRDYASGGIYVDLAQTATPTPGIMENLVSLATSLFAGIQPSSGKAEKGGGSNSSGSDSSGGKKSGGKGKQYFLDPQAAAPAGAPVARCHCSKRPRRRRLRCRMAPVACRSPASRRIAKRRSLENFSTFSASWRRRRCFPFCRCYRCPRLGHPR